MDKKQSPTGAAEGQSEDEADSADDPDDEGFLGPEVRGKVQNTWREGRGGRRE